MMERDLVAQKLGISVSERLATLESRIATTAYRDDLFIVYISLLNNQKRYEEALELLKARRFHPWEGGEGKVSAQYMYSLIEQAKELLLTNPEQAIHYLLESQTYPENLGEGKLPNVEDNLSNYYIAKAYETLGIPNKQPPITKWPAAVQMNRRVFFIIMISRQTQFCIGAWLMKRSGMKKQHIAVIIS
ncbi:hypothetical protein [uncultured Enterococcus sp.]|uniref:hypothetical protein n=1 Tax=uncultured Enterococcus sp. TaxID=167972 RepID=UPI002AA730D4|nr:hypothetical protein [uncultured Enterococcus sp.]